MSVSHAVLRARQRCGLELTPADLAAIAVQIETREEAIFERIGRVGSEVWKVKVQGVWVMAVYRPGPRCVATFLPLKDEAAWFRRKRRRAA